MQLALQFKKEVPVIEDLWFPFLVFKNLRGALRVSSCPPS